MVLRKRLGNADWKKAGGWRLETGDRRPETGGRGIADCGLRTGRRLETGKLGSWRKRDCGLRILDWKKAGDWRRRDFGLDRRPEDLDRTDQTD
jgi:hypothetical protein